LDILEQVLEARIVAILRGDYQGKWLDYARALLHGGVNVMEVTLNSPGALDGIRLLKAQLGDRIILGAGTVLAAEEVHAAYDAGASFIVSPDTDESVIVATKSLGLASMPGAYTATEIKRAYLLGADVVKVFPSQTPEYLKAVRSPLNHIPMMATGGVEIDNAAEFFKVGACMLGIGSYLTKPNLSPDEVAMRAARFVAVAQGRQIA
jgi:2-dehydro-3-deoxyphosphogluconate aldolase / (4S)-4-hydroxy-2-oxoglutarate aldolase